MKTKPKILITLAGGGYGRECLMLIDHLKDDAKLIYTCPRFIEPGKNGIPDGNSIDLPDLQSISSGSKITSITSGISIFFKSLIFIIKEKPNLVAGITARESVFVLAAARLLGVQTVFIESITRVNKPSLTLKLISKLKLSKNIWVQWPELAQIVENSEFRGRVI